MKKIRIGYTIFLVLVLGMAIVASKVVEVQWHGVLGCIWLFLIYEIICNVIFLTAKHYDKEIIKQAMKTKDIDQIRIMCKKTVAWEGLIKTIDETLDEGEYDKTFLTEIKGYLNSIIRSKKTMFTALGVISAILAANIWREIRLTSLNDVQIYNYLVMIILLTVLLYVIRVRRYFNLLNEKRVTLNKKINTL